MEYFLQGDVLKMEAQSVLFAYPGEAHFLIGETPDFDMYVAVISGKLLKSAPVHPPVSPDGDRAQRPNLRRLAKPDFREVCDLSALLVSTPDQEALEWGGMVAAPALASLDRPGNGTEQRGSSEGRPGHRAAI